MADDATWCRRHGKCFRQPLEAAGALEPTGSASAGHELQSTAGLLQWLISQQKQRRCDPRAIVSGFSTIVLADLIRDVVIPRSDLHGGYRVATRPISKFDLLRPVAERYGKKIEMNPADPANSDRTLVAARAEKATGHVSPGWQTPVDLMYCDRFGSTRV